MSDSSLGQLLQILAGGITAGSVYALISLGFSMVYNVSRVVNLAQGEFVSIGALMMITLSTQARIPLIPALIISILASTGLGLLLERFGIRTAKGASLTTLLIITIGASIFLRGVALVLWGRDPYSLPAFVGEAPLIVFGAAVQPQMFLVIGTLVVVGTGLWFFFERTWLGKAVLACSENPQAASLIGINVRKMVTLSFALSAAIGALGGAMVAPITFMTYDAGAMLGLKGFVAAILGGLGNNAGSILGGLMLGVIESLAAGYLSSLFKEAVSMVVLLLVLFTRPDGLWGRRTI